MKAFVYSLLFFPPFLLHAQSDSARTVKLLDSINRALDRAVVQKDVAYMEKHFAADFYFYHATGMIDSKESWIAKNKNPNNKMLSREHDSVTVELHPDIGVLKGTMTVLFPPEQKRAGYAIKYIRVYAKRKNTWQLVSHNSTAQWTVPAGSHAQSKSLDQYFSKLAAAGQFNGNILVAENGQIVYEKAFGFADFSAKKLNTINTSFLIASVTKTMTSTAILQMMERGKLQVSDAYAKYFPEFPYPSVTISQLLSHTSTIPSAAFYRYMDSLRLIRDTFFVNADVIPAFIKMKKPLLGTPKPPGDRANFSYSNVNYYLLAHLIEKLSGMSYGGYIRKNIFIPAGMLNSSFAEFYFGVDPAICTEHRYKYLYDDVPERIDTLSENAYIFKTYNLKGHGDVVSTVHDLLKYDEALRKGILLKPATLAMAYQPIVYGTPDASGYGMGWSILHDSTGGKVAFHHGGSIGMEIMFVRNIAKNQVVICFDNAKNYAFNKAMDALKIMNGAHLPLPKQSVAKLYGKSMVTRGRATANDLLASLRKDSANYSFDEEEINLLGYQFLRNNQDELAYEVFKTNVALFPGGWNAWDSYGEILLKLGRKEEAIKMYEKSLALNPNNDNGKKMLEQIRK